MVVLDLVVSIVLLVFGVGIRRNFSVFRAFWVGWFASGPFL